jgi:hypothetical protein
MNSKSCLRVRPDSVGNRPGGFAQSNWIRLGFFLVAFFVMLCGWSPAQAQVSATIKGFVTDPSGAPVPSAAVQTKNVETGAVRNSSTDDAGRYLVVSLPVGEYEVRVTKSGFQDAVRSGFASSLEKATGDVSLQVTAVKSEVKVTGDATIVSTTTKDISGLVGEQQVKDLPLNGRSFDLLVTLNAVVVNINGMTTVGTGISNSTTGNNFAVSGNRPQQNLFCSTASNLPVLPRTTCSLRNQRDAARRDAVREFNAAILTDGIWQTARRPSGNRDAIGNQPVARVGVRVSAQQRADASNFF